MRFTLLPLACYRLMGITGLFLCGYIVLIGVFGKFNVAPYLPMKLADAIQRVWPMMPFFSQGKEMIGKDNVIYYTVPTRQLTPEEVARLMAEKPVDSPKDTKQP